MRRVLRLRRGDAVTIFDDEGWEHEGVIRCYRNALAEIEILRSYRPQRESPLRVTLAQAVTKGEKMDWIVEKATELGVAAVVPFFSSYTVPRLDSKKIEARKARWRKIALAAAKQSGRTRVPELFQACDFMELVARPWTSDLKLLLWEKESLGSLKQIREEKTAVNSLLLVVGPEGGLSAEEASEAMRHGFLSVRLGKRILRTETAAVAALALAQFLWGDLG